MPEMTASAEFVGMVQRLKALIRAESLASMGAELKEGGLQGFGMSVGPKGLADIV
jgi:NitT/TauT family transport system ATP-binding protein